MPLRKIWNAFKNNRLQVAGVTFVGQADSPSNSDGSYTVWCDTGTTQFGYPTLQFGGLNLKGINDVNCNALHVDPTAAAGGSPYLYDAPNDSYFFVDSSHPPTAPRMRFIDRQLGTYFFVEVSNGTLRTIVDPSQAITY